MPVLQSAFGAVAVILLFSEMDGKRVSRGRRNKAQSYYKMDSESLGNLTLYGGFLIIHSEMQDELVWWVALHMVRGVGPVQFRSLCDDYGSPREVFRNAGRLKNRNLGEAIAGFDLKRAERQLKVASEYGAAIITYEDDAYPANLRQFEYSPSLLFVLGDGKSEEKSVAIVGTRKPTSYGLRQAARFAEVVAESGCSVISGGARGIDTQAHVAALRAGGKTIVVLGSGLDRPYPRENRKLFDEIVGSGGAIVTEFPFGTKPYPCNFLRRNRIISGMADLLVVVEAGRRSGALNTASWAQAQGKEVFALPGPVDSKASFGTNSLIKRGAMLAQSPGDILFALGVSRPQRKLEPDLRGTEKKIYECLSEEPLHVDQIARKLSIEVVDLLVYLLSLELKGYVVQLPGKYFRRSTL